ncbi:hypothetical protein PRK78_003622 [Emydomyces testavorans]|uniref:Uncharacterized protein n=1 Tax=Emydomyces testavorans TaxID=2070801 RepID=A0AAF0DGJ8_9EURO|nr:hypothetical protein PRK78_003622 [Emydomyces testavorans]
MPSFVVEAPPQVKVGVSRPPCDDEFYVMERYAAHAAHCAPCAQPYTTIRSGKSLCPRGARHVNNMAQYVYSRDGKAYSVLAKNSGHIHQIDIPPRFEAVTELMRAFGHGQKIKAARPQVVVHDHRGDAVEALSTASVDEFGSPGPQVIQQSHGPRKRQQGVYQRGTLFPNDKTVKTPEAFYVDRRIKSPPKHLR